MSETDDESQTSTQAVLDYHQATKHSYQRYAAGPGYLDWESQPNPFRRYEGARLISLEKTPPTDEPLYDDAFVENQLTHWSGLDGEECRTHPVRRRFMRGFNPDDQRWRESVLSRGRELFEQGLEFLR